MVTASYASSIEFDTPAGATTSGPVSDKAIITTSAGQITIEVVDLLVNPTDVAQLISGFFFTLSNAPGTLPATVVPSASDVLIDNHAATADGSAIQTWAVTKAGNTVTVDDLNGGQPKELIIGPGPYSNANGSIDGNSGHNPFINQTATFTISASGVTANTTITGFSFDFGTTEGVHVAGDPVSSSPEESTIVLTSSGALLILLSRLRRRQKTVR